MKDNPPIIVDTSKLDLVELMEEYGKTTVSVVRLSGKHPTPHPALTSIWYDELTIMSDWLWRTMEIHIAKGNAREALNKRWYHQIGTAGPGSA